MLVNAVEFFQGPVTTLPEIVTRNPVWTRIAPNAFAMDGAVATIVLPATTVLSGAAMFDSWMWTPVKVSPAVNWLSLTTASVEPTKNRQMPGPHVTVFRVNCTPVAKPVIPSLLATAGPSAEPLASSTSRSTLTPAPLISSMSMTPGLVANSPAPATRHGSGVFDALTRTSALTPKNAPSPITSPGDAAASAEIGRAHV